mmetsp:Transcript_20409/g.40142  ORF Transcript_20409/g.40142 Transcript_20409/m.40142 type:complete len:571 (-) Transcript_20409:60-1772(-)|eukprot:CAMPEP_0171570746 /NCGR_PEP_ID=MMETSP0961-20121227/3129_1 /TAXON_ID=87120 /ORGANISM="Aurantiochytrium limacinum, Strain ATCCMYA-1381" /LENGTH=570 /DNA_ID=CAMNT_0012125297 /DNA_START=90 /DNA_END=1802 /DNA_ORIENTATION=-
MLSEELEDLSEAFAVDARLLGKGLSLAAWSPDGKLLAATGSSRVVQLLDQEGAIVDQLVPPSASRCVALAWSAQGETLAVVQNGSKVVLFWDAASREVRHVDLPVKDILVAAWCPRWRPGGIVPRKAPTAKTATSTPRTTAMPTSAHTSTEKCSSGAGVVKGEIESEDQDQTKLIAFGTSRGKVLVFCTKSYKCFAWDTSIGKGNQHKKRIECLSWFEHRASHRFSKNNEELAITFAKADERYSLVYVSDQQVLNICSPSGVLRDRINLKVRVLSLRCSEIFISAAMEDSSLMLYEMNYSLEPLAKLPQKASGEGYSLGKDRSESVGSPTGNGNLLGTLGSEGKPRSSSLGMSNRNHDLDSGESVLSSNIETPTKAKHICKIVLESSYGQIVDHFWCKAFETIIGFSNGTIVLLNVSDERIHDERCRTRYLRRDLECLCYLEEGSKFVTCGEDSLQVFNIDTWSLLAYEQLPTDAGHARGLHCTGSSGLVSVATDGGRVLNYWLPQKQKQDKTEACKPLFSYQPIEWKEPISPLLMLTACVVTASIMTGLIVFSFDVKLMTFMRIIFHIM